MVFHWRGISCRLKKTCKNSYHSIHAEQAEKLQKILQFIWFCKYEYMERILGILRDQGLNQGSPTSPPPGVWSTYYRALNPSEPGYGNGGLVCIPTRVSSGQARAFHLCEWHMRLPKLAQSHPHPPLTVHKTRKVEKLWLKLLND